MIIILISLLLLNAATAFALTEEDAREFIKNLRADSQALQDFVHPEELKISRRLGIEYDNTPNKFLISYEIEDNNSPLLPRITKLGPGYRLLTVTAGDKDHAYYFFDNKLISPVYYYSRDWTRLESEYFMFFISDPDRFNKYSMDRLDEFVEEVAATLEISETRLQRLRDNKIYYYLCTPGEEIKQLTGYQARGMYNLAYDYIISIYNCHFHEIAHLLINYKLQKLPLYTHPFLQEGFAVAVGGRGGRDKSVIANMGLFLEQSGFAGYKEYLAYEAFKGTDPSITYPVSGLYNGFLLDSIGGEKYLELYLKYSGENHRVIISSDDLPAPGNWIQYLASYQSQQPIDPAPAEDVTCEEIYFDENARVCAGENHTIFATTTDIKLNEEYLITSDDDEISVYDLRTDNLIAKYVISMSPEHTPIHIIDGFRVFSIDNALFASDLREYKILTGEQKIQ